MTKEQQKSFEEAARPSALHRPKTAEEWAEWILKDSDKNSVRISCEIAIHRAQEQTRRETIAECAKLFQGSSQDFSSGEDSCVLSYRVMAVISSHISALLDKK